MLPIMTDQLIEALVPEGWVYEANYGCTIHDILLKHENCGFGGKANNAANDPRECTKEDVRYYLFVEESKTEIFWDHCDTKSWRRVGYVESLVEAFNLIQVLINLGHPQFDTAERVE